DRARIAFWASHAGGVELALTGPQFEVVDRRELVPLEAEREAAVLLLESRRADVVVAMDEAAQKALTGLGSAEIDLWYDPYHPRSVAALESVEAKLKELSRNELTARLTRQGLPVGFGEPVTMRPRDIRGSQRGGPELISTFLPGLFL